MYHIRAQEIEASLLFEKRRLRTTAPPQPVVGYGTFG